MVLNFMGLSSFIMILLQAMIARALLGVGFLHGRARFHAACGYAGNGTMEHSSTFSILKISRVRLVASYRSPPAEP
jgi:hypothetical protein